MKPLFFAGLILTFLLGPGTHLSAAEAAWELKKDKDGIAVFTRSVEGSSYKAVKASMQVPGTVSALAALVLDSENCSEWAAHCKRSQVLTASSDKQFVAYTLNDLPWPVADREGITQVEWSQSPDTGAVTMIATILGGDQVPANAPKAKGAVRLTTGTTSWHFAPTGNNTVTVTSEAHIDPEGATPAWLTNRLLVGAPFDTLAAMRALLASGRYDDAEIPWLSEPAPVAP
jgi:hypothetical protein